MALPFTRLMTPGTAACLLANALAMPLGFTVAHALVPATLVFGICTAAALLASVRAFDDTNPVMPRLCATLFGMVYIGLLGSFLAQLRYQGGPLPGVFALALVVAVTKGTDIGAYTFGKLIGRHLMTPRLSPKKTWEGAVGGLVFAVLFAQLMTWLEVSIRGSATLGSVPVMFAFALCVSVAGQLGDLAESMIKREARVKDASGVIPGFGGVLDILDSLFLAAPVGWAILTVLRF